MSDKNRRDNLPPAPRTISQELAAQLPTMPAPKNPETGRDDPRAEPPSDPSLEEAVELLKSESPPAAERDRALNLIVKKVGEVKDTVTRVSNHDAGQDKSIAALAERMGLLETKTTAQSETIGGHAAKVAATAPAPVLTPPEALPPAPAPLDRTDERKPVTIVSQLADISRARGIDRLFLIAVLVFEIVKSAAPLIEALLRGGHQ